MEKYGNLKEELLLRIRQNIDMDRDVSDEEVKELIAKEVSMETLGRKISLKIKEILCKEIYDSIRKMDILQDLLEDETITEIMVNGPDCIFIEKNGKMVKSERKFESTEKLEDVIQKIVASCNRVVNDRIKIYISKSAYSFIYRRCAKYFFTTENFQIQKCEY